MDPPRLDGLAAVPMRASPPELPYGIPVSGSTVWAKEGAALVLQWAVRQANEPASTLTFGENDH